ncbi:MAG: hypothetical protein ACTSRT_21115 [Promethearchaeota archaeon]
MTEFWIDSNFFIAAREARQLPLLKRLFGLKGSEANCTSLKILLLYILM